jgi:hypothetical protein
VNVNRAGLPAGTYNDTITIAAPGATGSPQPIHVVLNLTSTPAVLMLSTHATALAGQPAAPILRRRAYPLAIPEEAR